MHTLKFRKVYLWYLYIFLTNDTWEKNWSNSQICCTHVLCKIYSKLHSYMEKFTSQIMLKSFVKMHFEVRIILLEGTKWCCWNFKHCSFANFEAQYFIAEFICGCVIKCIKSFIYSHHFSHVTCQRNLANEYEE